MEEYRSLIVSSGKKSVEKEKTDVGAEQVNKAEQRKAAADRRASLAPLKKKINEIESVTKKLETLIQALDAELADPVLYEKAPAKAAEKAKQRGEAAAILSAAEEQWLELSAEYEDGMAG
jgi:ATP-binding cassette subfamily F protein 3